MSSKKKVAIIGSGPAALMLAATLDETIFEINIYEKNFAPGRKFLVAGDGGFNLTHSEPRDQLISRYSPSGFLLQSLNSFTNIDLRAWLSKIGIETFVGSSKRVFPFKGIKPIEVLNAILRVLEKKKIKILTQHHWKGWTEDHSLLFSNKDSELKVITDYTVFALGGASWSKTGSDGKWSEKFNQKDINIIPFQPSNCAFKINWPNQLLQSIEGKWMKNISVSTSEKTFYGEAVCTQFGIEGTPIYASSKLIRDEISQKSSGSISLDLKPYKDLNLIQEILLKNQKPITECLKNHLKLGHTEIELLKAYLNKEEFTNPILLAEKIKSFPLIISGLAPIDEAISTVGGIDLNELTGDFELKKLKDNYAIGEMLDWDAPTGGYLLQACFSMGYFLGSRMNAVI